MTIYKEWFEEEYARGVPEENLSSLISEYSSRPESGVRVLDMVGGDDFSFPEAPDTLIKGATEGGRAIRFGAGVTGMADMEATAHPFLMAQSHTFEAWIRIEGSADQTIWTNQGVPIVQKLEYDSTAGTIKYTCFVDVAEQSVSFVVDTDRLTHVVITREYTGSDTVQKLYLDGEIKASETNSGAPVVHALYDDLTVGSNGSGDYFYGMIQGIRLYDDVLDATEILALHDAGQAAIELGAYATQTIIPTTAVTHVTGWAYGEFTDEADGVADEDYEYAYPVVLYKRTATDNWRALFVGSSDGDVPQVWQTIDELASSVYNIRFMVKNPCSTRDPSTGPGAYTGTVGVGYFDDLAGGEETPSSIISPVDVPAAKQQILEKIVMRNKPLHAWAGMVVRYV